jgi:NADP-dependent 3-hydroxy acid dehydrogenase YdfG
MTDRKPLVMITGASAGIGQETARVFSAAGYPLLLIARRPELIEAMGLPDTLAVAADVSDYDALADAIRQGEEKFGPVDCLVNNAGISRLARLDEQDPAQWRDLVDINCLGVLNGMHAVAPGMKERRHGTIINVSSIAGRKVYPHHDVYGGTKHFVHAVSEGMRQTMSAYRVRVMVRDRQDHHPPERLRLLGRRAQGAGRRARRQRHRAHHALRLRAAAERQSAGNDDHPYRPGILT